MMASVSMSSKLIACTEECLSRRAEGKALGFDLEVTTLAEVSGVCVPQSSHRTSVFASEAPSDLGKRLPQASQKRREPIATMMGVPYVLRPDRIAVVLAKNLKFAYLAD